MNANGSRQHQLGFPLMIRRSNGLYPVTQAYPDWSPDGRSLLYSGDRTGTFQIYAVELARPNDARQITHGAGDAYSGAWSPDGKTIAFDRDATGSSHIYAVDADGKHQRVLVPMPGNSENASWSPDGHKILFDNDV